MSVKSNIEVVTDGLVYYTDFGNTNSYVGSGNVVNNLSDPITTILYNSPTFSSANGGIVSFDGVNDYMGTPGSVTLLDGPMTVDAWVYPQTTASDGTVIGNWTQTNQNFLLWWDVGVTPNFRAIQMVTTTTSVLTSESANRGTANQWNHVSVTVDATDMRIYLDGVHQETVSTGSLRATGSYYLRIGADTASARNLNGDIAPVKIYNRALTADEVAQNYNALKNRFV